LSASREHHSAQPQIGLGIGLAIFAAKTSTMTSFTQLGSMKGTQSRSSIEQHDH
jgi:hypothetical protein